MKASKREDAAQVLTNYIATHGFVSDETAETIRKILEEKDKEPKISVAEIKQMIHNTYRTFRRMIPYQ